MNENNHLCLVTYASLKSKYRIIFHDWTTKLQTFFLAMPVDKFWLTTKTTTWQLVKSNLNFDPLYVTNICEVGFSKMKAITNKNQTQ